MVPSRFWGTMQVKVLLLTVVPSLHPGLSDRSHHQQQHQLFPHIQEDVPAQTSAHGHQPCCPPRARGLSPPVLRILSQCFPAHVSFSTPWLARGGPPRHPTLRAAAACPRWVHFCDVGVSAQPSSLSCAHLLWDWPTSHLGPWQELGKNRFPSGWLKTSTSEYLPTTTILH